MDQLKSADLSSIFSNLWDKLKNISSTKTIFGDPIKEDDITIIPVWKVLISGGGGLWGGETEELEEKPEKKETENEKSKWFGGGFGWNITVKPIGYIKIKDWESEFIQIIDKTDIVLKSMLLGGLLVLAHMIFAKKTHK